jgi:hypothetical protein
MVSTVSFSQPMTLNMDSVCSDSELLPATPSMYVCYGAQSLWNARKRGGPRQVALQCSSASSLEGPPVIVKQI